MIQAPNHSRADRLEQMVRLYEKDLLRICCVYLRDRAAAEDAVQETFLKAYKSLDSFRGDCGEKTWLIKIAVNRCRDIRKSAWYKYIDLSVAPEDTDILSPESASEESIALTTAIMRLRPKYLEVVLLYYYEGYSVKEIAGMLNRTEAAVSARIQKAKRKLKDALTGGDTDDE